MHTKSPLASPCTSRCFRTRPSSSLSSTLFVQPSDLNLCASPQPLLLPTTGLVSTSSSHIAIMVGYHTTHSHVLALPTWLIGLRVAQMVVAVVILGLVAYSTSLIVGPNMDAAYGLNLFTSAATLIVNVWLIVALMAAPMAYNMWAHLAMEIFLTVMWLVSFAVLAAYSASFILVSTWNFDPFFKKRSAPGYIPWETGAAASGLGGLELLVAPTVGCERSN